MQSQEVTDGIIEKIKIVDVRIRMIAAFAGVADHARARSIYGGTIEGTIDTLIAILNDERDMLAAMLPADLVPSRLK